MIVIYRNGVPTVVTGWRAWLIMLGRRSPSWSSQGSFSGSH